MQRLNDLLKTIPEIRDQHLNITERGELMREFIENINLERDKKFPPVTFSRMGLLLEGLNNQSLYSFLAMCKDRKIRNGSFSKFFWWALKK